MIKSALLVLEDGTQLHGRVIGATGSAVGEIVFNIPVTDHQEILTDPSYSRQIVTFTYPRIGSVGTNETDAESPQVHVQGLAIRDLPLTASNFHDTEDLSSYLKCHNIVAIVDIDTRKLTCLLCEKGAQNDCIIVGDNPDAALILEKAKTFPGLDGMDLAKKVTTAEPYSWTQGSWALAGNLPEAKSADEMPFHVVAYNFGAKCNILRMLADCGCRLMVAPVKTSAEDVLKMNPDGIFLSNGPGDPVPCDYAITAIQKFFEADILVFGICLDHQLLALANGAKTIKMKLGHHGSNHPVKDTDGSTVIVTAQNHGFAVDEASTPANLRVTRKSPFDGTLQGIYRTDKPAFSFQGHPEASPGPYDTAPLSDRFIELIEQYRQSVKQSGVKESYQDVRT